MSQHRQFKGPPSFAPLPESTPIWSPTYQGSPTFQQPITPLPNVQRPQWLVQTGQSTHCNRCGKELGFLDRIGLDQQTPRCRSCTHQVHQSLERFRRAFIDITRSGKLSDDEWAALQHIATQERLDKSEALAFIMNDAIALIERIFICSGESTY